MNLPYRIIPIDISKGLQFEPSFLALSPNNRVPALIDSDPQDGGAPISIFESGAILIYLAEKTGQFLPKEPRERANVMKWLMWQMGGLGPIGGQNYHFVYSAPETIPYAVERFAKEMSRLFTVLDRHLTGRNFIADDYSIADMAVYPWIVPHKDLGQDLDQFPQLKRWFEILTQRPAIKRAYEKEQEINS